MRGKEQVLRSGTSIGANIAEAKGGISKADFRAKMQTATRSLGCYGQFFNQQRKILLTERSASLITETCIRLPQPSHMCYAEVTKQLLPDATKDELGLVVIGIHKCCLLSQFWWEKIEAALDQQ